MVYTCRIELGEIAPKIWREFQFHPGVTFHQLHKIIQVVMGWENCHLYEFHVNERVIGLPNPTFEHMEDREVLNARKEVVQNHVNEENSVFTYVYDFGDDWRHTIILVKIDESAASDPAPMCLDGARSCPQEDVGGVWGHQHMLEVLLTPNHPERDQFIGWVRAGYDPEHFSCEEVNHELQRQKDKLIPKSLIKRPVGKKPAKLTKSALNKHLKQLTNDQLIELVKACYGASKEMEKFLAVRILGDEAAESLFQEYRKKIEKEFFPERGFGKLRLQEAKNAISEFERLTGNVKYSLELKLIYVENGVDFTLSYGDIDERFYYSMASVYADIIDQVNEDEMAELFDEFEDRLEAIVLKTVDIGWGFHDNLAELHAQLRWI
ncbi:MULTISPECIES: DUF6155 family protein [unclassified Paenibacillus]|uniref:DUF6155 family protein n=1 Tax=unclassified Paenibacillus TaxID=185978 RepID=UPI001C0F7FB7|nr:MULTISPECIES: DUF6155 family protein [unclassified Paenibacillus]MBU5445068.1 plasmid pRiA4b ORF-3 family protein [Paenibacillus sp. MSJ-34]CAH0119012.1 hypothetical protein PAE9249_01509 [Paenibacillus sp. CECT 9249]